jgi:putative ABC transport system permease protein
MLENYFKVALRNILKHKFYSSLNIAGLALGLAACILIGLYIVDELGFDKFHKDFENIHAVALHGKIAGQEVYTSSSSPPIAEAMVREIPGVESSVRIQQWYNVVVKFEDKAFTESSVIITDSNFFNFFSFRLREGDPAQVLREANSVVMTPAAATRYFGTASAIGKIVTVGNDNRPFKVTGIADEPPGNSQIKFEMIFPASSNDNMKSGNWMNNGLFTYFRKNPQTTIESVDAKLADFVRQHVSPTLEQAFGISYEEFVKGGGVYSYYAYPMADQHLFQSELQDGLSPKSDIKYVYILAAVGAFILLIACINFMNLSTARSASRAKEVGLRKTLGSARGRLVAQFLSESFVYVLIATLLAVSAAYITLPSFNLVSGKLLDSNALLSPVMVTGIVATFLVVSLLAGSYPAFYLTSFKPVDVLKGKMRAGMKSKGIRSGLVVVQFTISITLIITTMVVYQQLNYLQEKNIGMDKQNVLILRNTRRLAQNMDAFKENLLQQTGIASASYTNNVFPGVNNTTIFRIAGTEQDHIMGSYYADYDHMATIRIELAEGRFFSRDFPSDSSACLINEAAVKELGWTDAVNRKLTSFNNPKPEDLTVVGVMKDFNFESFKSEVRPLIIELVPRANNILIRYEGSATAAVDKTREVWKKLAVNEPFEYTFMDQNFDELFREEQRLGQVFTVMTGIAIFVACLGLMGLASFTAEQRTKEIGIRKVMGASVSSVNTLLSREFMVLVAVSFVLAAGISWYAMNNWLSSFAYRIELGVVVFIVAGAAAAAIAWVTVSFHFIKAARLNPSESLRYE